MAGAATAKPAAAGAAAGEGEAAPKRKGGLMRLIAIVLVLVIALGAGGWFLQPWLPAWARIGKSAAKPEPKREPPVKVTVPVASLVVNLGRPETKRYLKISIELGLTDAKRAKEVEEHKSRITDLIISTLAETPVEALGEEDGRAELKQELLEKIR